MTQPTPKEIAIGRPPVFDGDRAKAALFIKSCKVYLQINKAIYDADDKRIAFILSFMTEGTAATWASQAMDRALSKEGYKDLAEFEEQFNTMFAPIDNKEMSYLKLTELKQANCKGGIGEYIAQFQLLSVQAGIKEFHILKRQFITGLYENLRRAMDISTTKFTKIEELFEIATIMNDAFLRERSNKTGSWRRQTKGGYSGPKLKKLTIDEKNQLIKEGKCFRCRQKGHMAAQCQNNQSI